MNEDRRTNRRGRQPVGLDTGVHPGHHDPADGPTDLAPGLVRAPDWWPFTYTTTDNLKRIKRRRAVLKVQQWVRWPEALF